MKKVFRKEFERRLYKLMYAIDEYQHTGNTNNVLPRLFHVISYVWCFNPFKELK